MCATVILENYCVSKLMGKETCRALVFPCLARYLNGVCLVSFILHKSWLRKPYVFFIITVDLWLWKASAGCQAECGG